MTGPFVFVLVGVPSFLRRKLYPQKLLVLSKKRLNWGGLDLPIGQAKMERTWGQDTGPPPGWLQTSRTQGHLLKLS